MHRGFASQNSALLSPDMPSSTVCLRVESGSAELRDGCRSRHGYRLSPLPLRLQAANGSDRSRLHLAGLVAQLFAYSRELADLSFTFPAWYVRLVEVHEAAGPFEHLRL